MRDDRSKKSLRRLAGSRTLRLDQPAVGTEKSAAESGTSSWFERFRNAIRAAKKENRLDERYRAVEHEIWIGWWKKDQFEALHGYLEDISRGGARIVLSVKPPKNQPIWIYKEIEEAMSCVRAQAVGMTPAPNGAFSARFRFAASCPSILRDSATARPVSLKRTPPQDIIDDDDFLCA